MHELQDEEQDRDAARGLHAPLPALRLPDGSGVRVSGREAEMTPEVDLNYLAEQFTAWAVNDPVKVLITLAEARAVAAALRARLSETQTTDEAFHAGTLAALDVVYLHDQQVIAAEIVNATNHEAMLRWAVKDGYHNLAALKETIRSQHAA
jgi:hypothetical protein